MSSSKEADKVFDLNAFRTARSRKSSPRKTGAKQDKQDDQWHCDFFQIPRSWAERLVVRRIGDATYRLVLLLLYERFRQNEPKNQPIVLSNKIIRKANLSRQDKWRALAELECLQLVYVRRRKGASPRVTLKLKKI